MIDRRNRYRIVARRARTHKEAFNWAQYRVWWSPFWRDVPQQGGLIEIDELTALCERHAAESAVTLPPRFQVVKKLGPLP